MFAFRRSFLACLATLSMMAQLSALAQTTSPTPWTDPSDGWLTGTQTVTTSTLTNGNTVETTTNVATGTDASGHYVTETYSYSTEKDAAGNKVHYTRKLTRTTFDKKGGKQLANDTWSEKEDYNEAGGYHRTYDDTKVNNETGETTDDHSDGDYDAAGRIKNGHSKKTTRKPGEKPVVQEENWNPDSNQWEKISLASPALENISAQPGDGASDETAVVPDLAGPSSQIVATFNDPDRPGPSGQAIVAFEDSSGHRTFFKTVADAQHHLVVKIAEGIAAVWLFKDFKRDGTPDDGAVRCAIARNGTVAETQAVPNVPANGPAITRASSAYERGGSSNGLVSMQTRGNDPVSSRILMDGSQNGIQTEAASNMNVKARLTDDAGLGRHTFSLESRTKTSNAVPADVVTLRADPVPAGETGSVAVLTVHCDGLPASDSGTMFFQVSGSARLEDGTETTSVPVQNGIAQVRIRGMRSGPALVKFKLQARISGFWVT